MEYYRVSERKACRVPGQCRATQRYEPKQMNDEELLRNCVTSLASRYGRYGYKRVTVRSVLLPNEFQLVVVVV